MWVSWFVRFCVVEVCEMRACARVCASDAGVERAMVVDARAVRAVEPWGVRCARRFERMCASLGLVVFYLVSVYALVSMFSAGFIPHLAPSALRALHAP